MSIDKSRVDKYVWKEGDVKVTPLQCTKCKHKKPQKACTIFGNIPKVIWDMEHRCTRYETDELFKK